MAVFLKRRILPLILLCALALGLAACSGDSNVKLDPQNPVTIVIWHYYHGAQKNAFDEAVKEFNETLGFERGIIAEAVSHGGVDDLAANITAAAKGELDAGSMPNIFGSYGDTALEILNMDKAVEIDTYLTESELAEYEESFIHEGKIGTDKVYVFPIAKSTESLMLNKTDFDLFAQAADETVSYDDLSTWEGILKVADAYYRYTDEQTPDAENDGKAFFGIDSLANYIIVGSKQLGQDLVVVENKEVTINLDKDIMTKLWDTYYEPMVTGKFVKLGRFCSDDIKTGDSLGYIGSTSSANYFPTEMILDDEETRNIELMVLPMPVFEGGDKVSMSQGAGMVIAKSDKEKEYASALFLKWFTETDRNMSFSLSSSYLPVKKESLNDDKLNKAFETIEKSETSTQNTIKALKVGIDQLRQYSLYTSDVFDGSTTFRDTLSSALQTAAQDDRVAFDALVESGISPEEAYSELYTQSREKIDGWIKSLMK